MTTLVSSGAKWNVCLRVWSVVYPPISYFPIYLISFFSPASKQRLLLSCFFDLTVLNTLCILKKYFSFFIFLLPSCCPCPWTFDVMYLQCIFCHLTKVETPVSLFYRNNPICHIWITKYSKIRIQ